VSDHPASLQNERILPARLALRSDMLNLALLAVLLVLPFLLGGSWTFALGLCFANAIGVLSVSVLVRYGGEVSIGHTFFAAVGAYSVAVLDTRYGLSVIFSLPLALGIALRQAVWWLRLISISMCRCVLIRTGFRPRSKPMVCRAGTIFHWLN